MSLSDEYVKKFKTPSIIVTITKVNPGEKPSVDAIGVDYISPNDFNVISCRMSFGLGQSASTCTLVIESDIQFKAMDRIAVDQGWNNVVDRTFFGFVDSVTHADFPRLMTLECRDILKLAMNNYYIEYNQKLYYKDPDPDILDPYGTPLGGQSEYDRYAENIISAFLVESGIPINHQDLEQVTIAGYHIIVGNHAEWHIINMSAMDAINQLCDLIGYKLWATPDGMVKLRMMRAVASESYSQAYSRQIDVFNGNQSFTTSTVGSILNITTDITDESLRNWVDIKGYTISGLSQVTYNAYASSDYVSDPPTYKRCEIQSDLIDTDSVAIAIGDQVLLDLNRLNYSAQVVIEGDPRVKVGQTIGIYDPYSTTSAGIMNYFLNEYSSDFSSRGYTTDLSLIAGLGTGSLPYGANVPPVAVWLYALQAGTIFCNGMMSYDPDGLFNNLTFIWTCPGYATLSGVGFDYCINTYDVVGSGFITVTLMLLDSGSPPLSSSLTKTIIYSGMV